MIKIGITGNIACGKSVAYKIIKSEGYPIIDADDIVKELYNNKNFADEVKIIFPNVINNNQIDKKLLSEILFSDKNFKSDFEGFIFPKVKEKIIEFFEENKNNKKIFVIVPLLFEAGYEKIFDKIIFISSDESIRLERLISRNSRLSKIADKVINSQISEDEKFNRSDYVIKNNGTLEEFRNAVLKIVVN